MRPNSDLSPSRRPGLTASTSRRLAQKGIPVSNVPVYSTRSVAQFVFALLLELCQNVARHAEAVQSGEWTSQPDFSLRKTPLFELAGKTMGIVGFGRIGRHVGEIAQAFGMTVIASQSSRPHASVGSVTESNGAIWMISSPGRT